MALVSSSGSGTAPSQTALATSGKVSVRLEDEALGRASTGRAADPDTLENAFFVQLYESNTEAVKSEIGTFFEAMGLGATAVTAMAVDSPQVVGTGQPGGWLVAILALNPIDGIRALGLIVLGADVLLGPTGAALRGMLGTWGGGAWVATSLMAWTIVPLLVTTRVFRRRDF